MRWQEIPDERRIRMKPGFRDIVLKAKGSDNWDIFSVKVGISKMVLHNYIYGKMPSNPDIKALKTLMKNTTISSLDIESCILWNKDLELLTEPRGSLNNIIIVKGNRKLIDLEIFCKGLITKNSENKPLFPIKTKSMADNLKIWYESKHTGIESKPYTMKKYIPLDEQTFIAFGLIQAESCKKPGYGFFDFTNSDPILSRYIVSYFQTFWNVDAWDWKCFIHYWRPTLSRSKIQEIKLYWNKKLNIPINNITVYHGTKKRRSITASPYGVSSIRINNRAFRTVVIDFMENVVKKMVLKNTNYLGHYLTGLFSGDGTLSREKGEFRFIGLAFDPHSDEIDHCYKILKLIGIIFNKKHLKKHKRRLIFIHHWKDQLKLLQITNGKLFLDKRNKVFLNGFLNNQYIRPLVRLCELKDFQPITIKKYSEKYRITKRSANYCLKRMERLNLLYYDNKHVPFKFFLTEYGNNFVKLINKLQRMKGG